MKEVTPSLCMISKTWENGIIFLAETNTVLSRTQATAGAASPSWDRGKILLSFSECETNPLLNIRGASREAGSALNVLTEVLVSPPGCSQCSCCQPGTISSPSWEMSRRWGLVLLSGSIRADLRMNAGFSKLGVVPSCQNAAASQREQEGAIF